MALGNARRQLGTRSGPLTPSGVLTTRWRVWVGNPALFGGASGRRAPVAGRSAGNRMLEIGTSGMKSGDGERDTGVIRTGFNLHATQQQEIVPETRPEDRHRQYERRMALWLAVGDLAISPMAAAVGAFALIIAL